MQQYQELRDSGVAWLGDIPKNWQLSRINAHFRRKKVTNTIDEELLSVYRDYGVIPKSSRDDNHNAESEDLSNYQLVEPDDLVTNKMKTWQGSIAISSYRGIVSPAYYILRPISKGKLYPKYIHYLLRSKIYISQYQRYSKGIRVGQWDLEYDQFKTFPLLIPDTETQKNIAKYIELETSRIDEIISKQEQLLKLQDENRNARIYELLTKGLDRSVDLVDSRVPWLGQVPKHWKIPRASVLFSENKISNNNNQSTLPLQFRFGEIVNKDVEVDAQTLKEIERYILINKGDILINGLNLNYDFVTQRVAVSKTEGCITPAYIVLRSKNKDLSVDYATYLLKSLDSLKVLNGWGTGIRLTLNYSEFKKVQLLLPPIKEQYEIVEEINKINTRFTKLKNSTLKQVELLKERRISLVSNAVTGKIKV